MFTHNTTGVTLQQTFDSWRSPNIKPTLDESLVFAGLLAIHGQLLHSGHHSDLSVFFTPQ